MADQITQSFALGVGVGGALVAVDSALVRLVDPVERVEGRDDSFRADTPPGTLEFTLDNYDGRFTPDNWAGAVAAGYGQPLSEGSAVSWSRGGKLWLGSVRGFRLGAGSESGALTVIADDALGDASRTRLGTVDQFLGRNQSALTVWYPFTDAAGSSSAAAGFGGAPQSAAATFPVGGQTFGIDGAVGVASSQVKLTGTSTGVSVQTNAGFSLATDQTVGVWVTMNVAGDLTLRRENQYLEGGFSIGVSGSTGRVFLTQLTGSTVTGPVLEVGVPYYLSAQFTNPGTRTLTAYLNGVSFGSFTFAGTTTGSNGAAPTITVTNFGSTTADFNLSEWYFGPNYPFGVLRTSTATTRLNAIAELGPVTFDTLPTFTELTYGPSNFDGLSVLDAINEVMYTEQGYVSATTTGTLTSPTTVVTIRNRDRPPASTISAANTFDAVTELADPVEFVRDLTYLVLTATADGPTTSATYTNESLAARAGTANSNDTVLYNGYTDLYVWASDRSTRGANLNLRTASLRIDSLTTTTDRSSDLLALKLGDRVRVTNLPSTILGFTYWDGWIVGITETYTTDENSFTFQFAPALPDAPLYDTARYMGGTELTLVSTVNTSVTTLSVASSGTLFTTAGADFPQTILIDQEVMTVTAVSGASSPQTFTVTRAATDPVTGQATTAASHSAGATVDLTPPALYAF